MSIWYDGNNLNMYRGDSGSIIFKNLPCCEGYRVYFSIKSANSNEIIIERSGDVSFYYIDILNYQNILDLQCILHLDK